MASTVIKVENKDVWSLSDEEIFQYGLYYTPGRMLSELSAKQLVGFIHQADPFLGWIAKMICEGWEGIELRDKVMEEALSRMRAIIGPKLRNKSRESNPHSG